MELKQFLVLNSLSEYGDADPLIDYLLNLKDKPLHPKIAVALCGVLRSGKKPRKRSRNKANRDYKIYKYTCLFLIANRCSIDMALDEVVKMPEFSLARSTIKDIFDDFVSRKSPEHKANMNLFKRELEAFDGSLIEAMKKE